MCSDEEDAQETNKELIAEHETPPDKSENDTKEYSVIKLKNGLTALLISDVGNLIDLEKLKNFKLSNDIGCKYDNYDKNLDNLNENENLAACSLTVRAGSFNDIKEIPGLAHFVEHVLTMGSEQYPDENEFTEFLVKVGGSDNAVTESEHTTFSFECPEIYFYETLKRFSCFFISPLIKKEWVTREREAVHSEFQMHCSSDLYRAEQIFCTTATPENPLSKLGNLKTLYENISDDELYKATHHFWKKYYLANHMTVTVQARLPLKTLEKWVSRCFSKIQSNYDEINELPKGKLFNMELFNKIYKVDPVLNRTEVCLMWILPPLNYQSKPSSYIEFLIGHEGEGSLASYLKKKGMEFKFSSR